MFSFVVTTISEVQLADMRLIRDAMVCWPMMEDGDRSVMMLRDLHDNGFRIVAAC